MDQNQSSGPSKTNNSNSDYQQFLQHQPDNLTQEILPSFSTSFFHNNNGRPLSSSVRNQLAQLEDHAIYADGLFENNRTFIQGEDIEIDGSQTSEVGMDDTLLCQKKDANSKTDRKESDDGISSDEYEDFFDGSGSTLINEDDKLISAINNNHLIKPIEAEAVDFNNSTEDQFSRLRRSTEQWQGSPPDWSQVIIDNSTPAEWLENPAWLPAYSDKDLLNTNVWDSGRVNGIKFAANSVFANADTQDAAFVEFENECNSRQGNSYIGVPKPSNEVYVGSKLSNLPSPIFTSPESQVPQMVPTESEALWSDNEIVGGDIMQTDQVPGGRDVFTQQYFEEDVLLVPGVDECRVGSIEAILDCMKTFCGSHQSFQMVHSLEIALANCKPDCRIFLGRGEHPISSLGIIGRSGGQLCGPIAGSGQAIITPKTSDHVWLNVLRSSNVIIQNVTVLLDKEVLQKKTRIGPNVGFLVQGKLRLTNVIITTKLNDNAENPSRAISGIELTENASLLLSSSTIKHCSIGLISQSDAETEIYLTTIIDCVIGFQSAIRAKNYVRSLNLVNCGNYGFMVDSGIHGGEGSLSDLKEEDSFCIEELEIKECGTEVYFVMMEPNSSSSNNSDEKGDLDLD